MNFREPDSKPSGVSFHPVHGQLRQVELTQDPNRRAGPERTPRRNG
jgi:hypothetical protein